MAGISGKLGAVYQEYTATDKSKLIADFQDDESWSQVTGVMTDDSTNYRLGSESIRLTEDDNTGNSLAINLDGTSLNLAQFESGDASDTNDYIYTVFYISDVSFVSKVYLAFSDEAVYDGDPRYVYDINSGLVTGWNYAKIKKSAFTNTNMSDWSSIQSIRIGWTSEANAINEYVSFQALYLVDDSHELILANNTAYTMAQKTLCYNWSLDASSDNTDITTLGNEWKSIIPTLNSYTVTIEKFWDADVEIANLGSAVGLTLYTNTTNAFRYDGLSYMDSQSVSDTISDSITTSLNYTGSADLYYTNLVIKDS